jgi:hypothetical protein
MPTNRLTAFTGATLLIAAGAVSLPSGAAAIEPATAGVAITPAHTIPVSGHVPGEGATALYVESTGTVHVASISEDRKHIELCTIPAGSHSCGAPSTLTTDAIDYESSYINLIKYLPAQSGGAYLAVGITELQNEAGTETEVFAPGRTTGINAGVTCMCAGGDAIFKAPEGVDVVGHDDDSAFDGAFSELTELTANQFEFESLAGGTDSLPAYVGPASDAEATAAGSAFAIDLTELPQGQTAVFAETDSGEGEAHQRPLTMFVQPAAGGPLGPEQPLGITGPIVADHVPSGASYVMTIGFEHALGVTSDYPMELYRFRGTSLVPVASIGASEDSDANEYEWSEMPPTYEDEQGNFYITWITSSGEDGCPVFNETREGSCLMYRRISANGAPGPTIVLAAAVTNVTNKSLGAFSTTVPVGVEAISVDSKGAGWLLGDYYFTGAETDHLYAQPLPSSAAITSAPSVHGTSVEVPLSCAGASGACSIEAQLTTAGSSAKGASTGAAAKARTSVIGTLRSRIAPGKSAKLVVKLNAAARKRLRGKRHVKAHLQIGQTVGAVKTPTTILTQTVTLK